MSNKKVIFLKKVYLIRKNIASSFNSNNMTVFGEHFEKNRTMIFSFLIFMKLQFEKSFRVERFACHRILFELFDELQNRFEFEHVASSVTIRMLERHQTQTAVIERQPAKILILVEVVCFCFLPAVKCAPFCIG